MKVIIIIITNLLPLLLLVNCEFRILMDKDDFCSHSNGQVLNVVALINNKNNIFYFAVDILIYIFAVSRNVFIFCI